MSQLTDCQLKAGKNILVITTLSYILANFLLQYLLYFCSVSVKTRERQQMLSTSNSCLSNKEDIVVQFHIGVHGYGITKLITRIWLHVGGTVTIRIHSIIFFQIVVTTSGAKPISSNNISTVVTFCVHIDFFTFFKNCRHHFFEHFSELFIFRFCFTCRASATLPKWLHQY